MSALNKYHFNYTSEITETYTKEMTETAFIQLPLFQNNLSKPAPKT